MATELSNDAARMDRSRSDAALAMTTVEFHREQDVRGLRAAIGDPRVIDRVLEVRIVEINIGEAMPCQPPAELKRTQLVQRLRADGFSPKRLSLSLAGSASL
jgi:hypothetical protein